MSLEVGGMIWFPKLDVLVVKVPLLHFGKIVRGRVKSGTKFFQVGTVQELSEFFSGKFTPSMPASMTPDRGSAQC